MTEHVLRKWHSHIDWWNMLPPGRPSAEHLLFFKRHLLRNKCRTVLLLGSTPEIRDLCAESGVEQLTIVDHSEAFYRHVSQQLVYDPSNETLIIARWQDAVPKLTQHYDAVIGDLISGNMSYEERFILYGAVARCLNKTGIFLEKILTNRPGYQRVSHLDSKYQSQPINLLTINDFANEYFFTSELVEARGYVDAAYIVETLEHRFANNARLRKMLSLSSLVVPHDAIWFYGKPWPELQQHYDSIFSVSDRWTEGEGSPFVGRLDLVCSTVKT